jgi:hypothetical protein
MTDSPDEHGEVLRRALRAEADSVVPSPEGLEIIRARIERGGPRGIFWWRAAGAAVGAVLVAATIVMVVPGLRDQAVPPPQGITRAGQETDAPEGDSTSRPPVSRPPQVSSTDAAKPPPPVFTHAPTARPTPHGSSPAPTGHRTHDCATSRPTSRTGQGSTGKDADGRTAPATTETTGKTGKTGSTGSKRRCPQRTPHASGTPTATPGPSASGTAASGSATTGSAASGTPAPEPTATPAASDCAAGCSAEQATSDGESPTVFVGH